MESTKEVWLKSKTTNLNKGTSNQAMETGAILTK
jgi:hypothetical protein